MRKKRKKIMDVNFFEKGGFYNHAYFILYIVFLMLIQIGVSFKLEDTNVRIRVKDQESFDLGMKSMSLKTEMMSWYKRTIIEKKVKNFGLKSSDKLPFIIELN